MSDFRGITGSGRYQTRGGDVVDVLSHDGSQDRPWKCGDLLWRNDDGRGSGVDHDQELAVGPLSDEPEMAGLSGFIIVLPTGQVYGGKTMDVIDDKVSSHRVLVDLSKVPANAIVKPEPKRETRKVWLAWFTDLNVPMTCAERPKHHENDPKLVAIIEREIEFTVGEGLEG